jgi:hypothetical protein
MNSIFFRYGTTLRRPGKTAFGNISATGLFLLIILLPRSLPAQVKSDPTAEFKKLAEQLSSARLGNGEETAAPLEKALGIADQLAVSLLNKSTAANAPTELDAANQQLANLVSHVPSVGENYRLVRLGGAPAAYAMVANFGLGGPAAVRIYSNVSGRFELSAKIDHFEQKDFLDSDIELIPMSMNEPVFVVVAGRTDDLATGIFTAWRFDGTHLAPLWSSDLLQQSSYDADGDGFHLTYCADPDDDHPAQCRKMTRETYRFQGAEWKRVDAKDLGPAKAVTK